MRIALPLLALRLLLFQNFTGSQQKAKANEELHLDFNLYTSLIVKVFLAMQKEVP